MLFQHRSQALIVQAPAKLNLFLEVLGKKSDGFHELETLMVAIGLFDTLRISRDPAGEILLRCHRSAPMSTCSGSVPEGPENLVVRAAELLRAETGCRSGARIDLWKRIPAAAGLAGGSSDAAAALNGLNTIWNLGLPRQVLLDLAARLGSDVPFFLAPRRAAICRGRGEQVEGVRVAQSLHFVIAKPPSGLNTGRVFSVCRSAEKPRSAKRLLRALEDGNLFSAGKFLHNGLQAPAETLNADVTRLKAAFSAMPVLGHQMSGSGTSYFGICAHRRHALQVSARLRALNFDQVFVARSLS